ncbi:MAG: HDOD domain-containing protein [Myxococcota bacterium]
MTVDPSPTWPLKTPLEVALEHRMDAGLLEIPILPHVAAQAMTMTQSAEADAARLTALIHGDQALAGHVLHITNSPVFAGATRIVSLQQAIARLGMRRLGEIVATVIVRGRVFKAPGFEDMTRDLWRHALCAGLYAKEVARARRRNVESSFLCGLLHDVGKPVVLLTLSDIAQQQDLSLERTEIERILRHYHCRAGAVLTQAWGLPEPVVAAAEHHHHPERALSHGELVWTVALANALANWAADVCPPEEILQHPSTARLNLYPDDMDDLMGKRDTVLDTLEAMA